MEEKQNPVAPKPPEQKTPQKAEEETLTFFNVMPNINKGNLVMPMQTKQTPEPVPEPPVVQPGVQPQVQPNISTQTATPELKKSKAKTYAAMLIIFAVLGAGAYFGIPLLLGNPYESENLLVNNPTPNATDAEDEKKQWVLRYFGGETCETSVCGEEADPDLDGLKNKEEFSYNTDPNNADSDNDGLADGDEVAIFSCDPLKIYTSASQQYTDLDHAKGAYNCLTSAKFNQSETEVISQKIKDAGLHLPTLKSLEEQLLKIYNTATSTTSSTPGSALMPNSTTTEAALPKDLDTSAEAKQERDTQRSLTIKNIGIALVKHYDDFKVYPSFTDFKQMHDKIKPYLKTASNPNDPINVTPYVYTYTPSSANSDFTLTFYSETAGQLIKKRSADAKSDKSKEEAVALDDQRRTHLESMRSALLIYSADSVAGNQEYAFPGTDKYKTALVPKYLSSVPKDPKTSQDYEYMVSETFDSFTLKAVLGAPAVGTTGFLCNQEECRDY